MNTRLERVHAALYAALICVLVGSGALFLSQFLTSEVFWQRFTVAYLGALVVYTWYLFALLLVHDVRPRTLPAVRRREDRRADPLLQRGARARRGLDPQRALRVRQQTGDRHRRRLDERCARHGCASSRASCRSRLHEFAENARQARGALPRDDAHARRRRRVRRHDRQRHACSRRTALVRVVEPLL